jgi:hypothetical protein
MTSIAKLRGASRSTLYGAPPELIPGQRGRDALSDGLDQATAVLR